MKSRRGSQKNITAELENGKILLLIVWLSIPAVIAQLITFLYNIVDRMYVARMDGDGMDALAAVINIVLDPIFIFRLEMGVRGSSLATVLSQFCSCLCVCLFFFTKKSLFRFRIRHHSCLFLLYCHLVRLACRAGDVRTSFRSQRRSDAYREKVLSLLFDGFDHVLCPDDAAKCQYCARAGEVGAPSCREPQGSDTDPALLYADG